MQELKPTLRWSCRILPAVVTGCLMCCSSQKACALRFAISFFFLSHLSLRLSSLTFTLRHLHTLVHAHTNDMKRRLSDE